jgi:hypothetical protein
MVYAIVTNHYKVLPSTKVTKGGFLGGGVAIEMRHFALNVC